MRAFEETLGPGAASNRGQQKMGRMLRAGGCLVVASGWDDSHTRPLVVSYLHSHGGFKLRNNVLAASCGLVLILILTTLGSQTQPLGGPQMLAQQPIPDAPKPQTTLPNLGPVTPGLGTTSTSGADPGPASNTPSAPAPARAAELQDNEGAVPTESRQAYQLHVPVNFVEIPFTVKDSKGQLVPGLTSNDIRVYENGVLQHISDFTTDPAALSVALVIDQTMTHDEMERLNDSLGALQAAFAPFDEIAVFTYNNGPKMLTDFTGAQSARLTQAIERSKGSGRDALMAGSLGGPLASTNVINDQNFDPNTAPVRGGNTGMQLNPPREVHALNDAILAAATALSKRPIDRRRVIYVISNGNEYGSVAKTKDVIKYLQTNLIQVDVTLVGESSLPVRGIYRSHTSAAHHARQCADGLLAGHRRGGGLRVPDLGDREELRQDRQRGAQPVHVGLLHA